MHRHYTVKHYAYGDKHYAYDARTLTLHASFILYCLLYMCVSPYQGVCVCVCVWLCVYCVCGRVHR